MRDLKIKEIKIRHRGHKRYKLYTDKKENQIFLIYKEIQNGAVAKSYMTSGPSSYLTLQLLHSEFSYM
jgi:hypothetical protein